MENEMPTGYTEDIKDGISFKTFALNCARAFGACVELRDEPNGGDCIPDAFEPSDYHLKAADKARGELATLDAMTPAEIQRAASKNYEDAETNRLTRLREIADLRASYETMLEKARAWVPPTNEHAELRRFMIEQIVESIRFDCDEDYYSTPIVRITGAEWAAQRRETLTHSMAYHTKSHAEEVERARKRTDWIAALRDSL